MARTAKIHRLTALEVKRYVDQPDQRKPLHDGGGLYLRKREAGAYWYLRLTDPDSNKTQWHRMFPDDPRGSYPHKTLAHARDEAARLWSVRSAGIDPRAERERQIRERRARDQAEVEATKRQISTRALFEQWARVELAPHTRTDGKGVGRKDGGEFVRKQFERRVFPRIGDSQAKSVTRADLLAILDEAKAEGKRRTANMLLSDLRQMFRFALAREIVDRNPLETITKRDAGGTEVERERVLTIDELRSLPDRLEAARLGARTTAAVWIILSTACRIGELVNAQWKDVDLATRTWHLPSTKNGRPHTIHLSDFALEHFQHLKDARDVGPDGHASPWVLPNRAGTGPVDIKTIGKQLSDRQREPAKKLQGRATNCTALQMPGGRWTAHDLRRTAATLMASIGVSGDVIDECLNHVIESRVRRTYVRDRRPVEQARAFDALGARISELVGGALPLANVVRLRA